MTSELIPPLPALRAFVAAARHGRFRDAASELGVTESAVSHQIRRLEELLRVQLFERHGPRVQLTDAGARYHDGVADGLARVAEATRDLLGPAERTRVALTLPPSLAIFWLIPGLAAFEDARPEIELQIITTTRVLDLRREQIDLAIRHGRGGWSDVDAEFLMAETAMPVARPGLVQASDDPEAALARQRLILNLNFPQEWTEWARARGVRPPSTDGALRLQSQEQVLAAAESGLGLAIGRSPLVDERLTAGALEAPFGRPDPSDAGFHLCWPTMPPPTAAARRVAAWLRDFARRPSPGP